jgi:hypothetical protein
MTSQYTVTVDTRKLDQIRRTAPQKAQRILRTIALDGEADVKRSFGTSPSSPGEPPGVDTGALRASIHTEKLDNFTQAIVCGVDYGAYLEFGTSRMAARPFFAPMAMRLQLNIDSYFDDFID